MAEAHYLVFWREFKKNGGNKRTGRGATLEKWVRAHVV